MDALIDMVWVFLLFAYAIGVMTGYVVCFMMDEVEDA